MRRRGGKELNMLSWWLSVGGRVGGPSVNILSWAAGCLCRGIGLLAWCAGALRQYGLQKSKEVQNISDAAEKASLSALDDEG